MADDAAGDDAVEVLEPRIDIEGDPVIGDPMADADADGGDLVLGAAAALDPDTDAVGTASTFTHDKPGRTPWQRC